jgi:hypothetical protein
LSFGQIPYANIETTEAVIEFVHSGERLSKPEMASDDMYLNFILSTSIKLIFLIKLQYNDKMLVTNAILSTNI